MKRVLMIAYSMNKGGMERQLATFLHGFDRNKLQVTLALFKNEIQYSLPADIKIIDLRKGRRFSLFFAFRLARLIASRHYDVIDCKLSTISDNIMLLCALMFKSNLIIEIRTSGKHLIPFYKRLKLLYSLFRQRWKVICNSKRACIETKIYLPAAINVEYIGNGINTSLFTKRKVEDNDTFTIGYVGRILPLKDLETLITAFSYFQKETPASELIIVGSINDKPYFIELKNLVRNLNLSHKVVFRKNIDEIEKFYNSLDLFVLPSVYEGTPNVLLEAMSSECVCLISEGANSDDFLPKEFIFDTNNAQQLFEKIRMVYSLEGARHKQIGRENREKVMGGYSMIKMVDLLTKNLLKKSK
jgi:glycosyltransferase involved in cell wall biosynthesis